METKEEDVLSKPLDSVRILEATHKQSAGKKIYTTGTYFVVEVFDIKDSTIYFESYGRLRESYEGLKK